MCDKQSHNVQRAEEHKRTHTGEKLACDQCKKKYATDKSLREHKKNKHPSKRVIGIQTDVVGGNRMYECIICETSYGAYRLPELFDHVTKCLPKSSHAPE